MKFQKDIKFVLSQKIFSDLKRCVKNASPNEACGLIFGDKPREIQVGIGDFQYVYYGKIFHCIESSKKSPIAFLIANMEEFYEILKNTSQKYNLQMLSIFHSHPSGAHPSGVDLNNMKRLDNLKDVKYSDKFIINTFQNQIWTIMDAKNYNLNGFIYLNDDLQQINLQIISD